MTGAPRTFFTHRPTTPSRYLIGVSRCASLAATMMRLHVNFRVTAWPVNCTNEDRKMTSRAAIVIATTSLLLAVSAGTGATEKMTVTVRPNISSAPSTVVVRAFIPQDSSNRTLHVGADSGSFYRSSDIQLDGDNAPLVTEVWLKNLPSGEYSVMAVLRDDMGHQTTVRSTVVVLSHFGKP